LQQLRVAACESEGGREKGARRGNGREELQLRVAAAEDDSAVMEEGKRQRSRARVHSSHVDWGEDDSAVMDRDLLRKSTTLQNHREMPGAKGALLFQTHTRHEYKSQTLSQRVSSSLTTTSKAPEARQLFCIYYDIRSNNPARPSA
jgi:hypothetical protein